MASIAIAAPVRPSANTGNDVTAARWAAHLERAGHDVVVVPVIESSVLPSNDVAASLRTADVLIALHARRSAHLMRWWSEHCGGRPLVAGVVGTDLYQDLPDNTDAWETVGRADALIVLQEHAAEHLAQMNSRWATKTHVVHQSVGRALPVRRAPTDEFRVAVVAHLRRVKDPLMAARAVRDVPASSRLVVHHAGRALDDTWQRLAETEAEQNVRYVWHGELTPDDALTIVATSTVLACTSLSEGGANVVTEAIALGVPVVGTTIGGNTGLLGLTHPGLVPVGDHDALRNLLLELESTPSLLAELEARSIERKWITDAATEQRALDAVVTSVL